nr:MAG TPA: hypothetical protein [Caudoviricetes sp.]
MPDGRTVKGRAFSGHGNRLRSAGRVSLQNIQYILLLL